MLFNKMNNARTARCFIRKGKKALERLCWVGEEHCP